MAEVFTTAFSFSCTHGGSVTPKSSAKLTVGGEPVLIASDSWDVSGCAPSKQSDSKCSKLTITGGDAQKLKAGGKAVALTSGTAKTDGVPFTVTVSGSQTKLKAS